MKVESMGKKLSPKEMELYRRTDEILHYLWDPCSVADVPQARDEYHNYLPQVFQLVLKKATEQEIVDYLLEIEVNNMMFTETPEIQNGILKIAEILLESRESIIDDPS
jgi:hypothetical protein